MFTAVPGTLKLSALNVVYQVHLTILRCFDCEDVILGRDGVKLFQSGLIPIPNSPLTLCDGSKWLRRVPHARGPGLSHFDLSQRANGRFVIGTDWNGFALSRP